MQAISAPNLEYIFDLNLIQQQATFVNLVVVQAQRIVILHRAYLAYLPQLFDFLESESETK